MQKKYGKKASITIFFAMLLVIISSFLFALLEAARIPGLHTKADVVSDTAIEAVFAEYQKEVYENYGLLLLDGAYGSGDFQIAKVEQRLEEMNTKNLYGTKRQTRDLYPMKVSECRIEKYQLATDDGGAAFRHLAATAAKREAGEDIIEDFSEKIQQKESLEKENGTVEEYLAEAERAKKEGKEPKEIAEAYHKEFVETFNAMNFSYDLYSKTETEYHSKKVQEIFKK